jgi:hypothetical protein
MRRADIEVPNRTVAVDARVRSACYPRGNFYPVSYGPSIRYRKITKPCFRNCSTCMSRSKAPLCLYTRRAISKRAEGTFGRLRYSLGGDRPSQTTRLALSPGRVHGRGLGLHCDKGGIPRMAPRRLTPTLHSLPPILDRPKQNPVPSCSKAPRGLSVLPRVTRIFTGITISPSPLLRQRPDRYAIRAGRNLPDKEFRYLRTVIVTAAVYWGFGSTLRLRRS